MSSVSASAPPAVQVLSPAREAWRVFRRNKAALLGLVLLGAILLVMLLGPGLYAVPAFDIRGAPFTEPFTERATSWPACWWAGAPRCWWGWPLPASPS